MASGVAPFDAEGMKGGRRTGGIEKSIAAGGQATKFLAHKEQAKREREGLGSSDILLPQGNFSFVARRGSACMASGSAPFDAEGMKGGAGQGGFSRKNSFHTARCVV